MVVSTEQGEKAERVASQIAMDGNGWRRGRERHPNTNMNTNTNTTVERTVIKNLKGRLGLHVCVSHFS